MRADFTGRKLPKTEEGVSLAIQAAKDGRTPVVIADHADLTTLEYENVPKDLYPLQRSAESNH